jgi:hypothetical protein
VHVGDTQRWAGGQSVADRPPRDPFRQQVLERCDVGEVPADSAEVPSLTKHRLVDIPIRPSSIPAVYISSESNG